jgi:hypothetical protein
MQMAVSIYKKGEIKSKLKASKIFNVPKSTFRTRLNSVNPRSETRANSYKLIAIEEEVLTKRLLDANSQGFLIRPEFLRRIAQILLRERT